DELRAFYQPIVDLDTEAVVHYEALVRWQRPETGLVAPSAFIGIAEHTGLIVPLGDWMLRRAVEDCAGWQATRPGGGVSVNVAARQLELGDIVATVSSVLAETGLWASLLMLEITESVLLHDAEQALETLRTLHDLGVGIALDDFGTGYSSLTYLRRLP